LTLRELHMEPSRGNAIFFDDNYREEIVATTLETGQSWTPPRPHLFQGMHAVRFDSVFDRNDKQRYAKLRRPGPRLEEEECFYYRSGGSFVFGGLMGYGGIGANISLGYYEFTAGLKYYPANLRPAVWDAESGWTYLPAYDTNPTQREIARNLVSNWILERWGDVIAEGLRAKVYKRLSDTERARTAYSLYSTLRQGFFTSEAADISGVD
jgi:hypothetical protein